MARYSAERKAEIEKEKDKLFGWFNKLETDFPMISLKQLADSSNIISYTNLYNARHYDYKRREVSVQKLETLKAYIVQELRNCYMTMKK